MDLDAIRQDDSLSVLCSRPRADDAAVLAGSLRLALTPRRRLRGLLGGPPLQANEALLLRPCNGVHTLFMRYAIDVVFIDRSGLVIAVFAPLRPWRATGLVRGARAALELPAGAVAARGVSAGQLVSFVRQ